ncbi:MAG: ABC transporter permease subunit [Firmicutes bacterium]|nr:ABC transporter permease subunit [Bacillota bacterium]
MVDGTTKKSVWMKDFKRNWMLYALSLPTLIFIIIFHYIPIYGIQLAFKDFFALQGIWGSPWVGFENFERFFRSYYFWELIRNTLGINIFQLVVGFPAPIILALLLNEVMNSKFKKTVQMVTYAPHFISTVVMVGIIGVFLSQETGVLNVLIKSLGFEAVPFLTSPRWFKPVFVLSGVWQRVGWGSIIYIATLAAIDQQLIEAAIVDGASKLQRIWYINIPGLMPTAIILLILRVGNIMGVGFEKVFLLQNPLNQSSSDVISTFVYRIGLVGADYSFATAVGLFNSVINCILLITVNAISRKVSETSLW